MTTTRLHTDTEARERLLCRFHELTRFRATMHTLAGPQQMCAALVGDILSVIDGHAQDLPGIDLMLRPHHGFLPGQIVNDGVSLSELWNTAQQG